MIKLSTLKSLKFIFTLKILAIVDIVFSSKFELKTFGKDGKQNAFTKFDAKEIEETI